MVIAGERFGLPGVCVCLAQHSVLVDAHSRAADGDHDMRPGKVESDGVLAKVFII